MNAISSALSGKHKGFTIIESVMAMVVLAIAAAGIVSLQGSIFQGSSDNLTLLQGSQQMQECAEYILSTRRVNGYSNVATSCSGIMTSAPTVSSPVTQAAGTGGCPSGGTCKVITIQQGSLSSVVLLLVQ